MITIFHAPRTRSTRVIWAAEELGVPYEIAPVVFGGPPSPELLAINPSGTVPALRDGEIVMTESVAILQYLADTYADGRLTVKAGEPGYADYLQHLVAGEAGLGAPLNAIIGTRLFGPPEAQDNWTCRMVIDGFFRRLKLVERQLALHPYVAGEAFTLADISVSYAIGVAAYLQGTTDRFSATVLAYQERVRARPAFQRMQAV